MSPKYVVITPARNEEQNLPHTIHSMVAQTIRPRRWVIVNDGSTDATGALADAAAREHDWITVVHRSDRGFRKQGGGVVEAFYDGFPSIDVEPWEFLVKFDADLSFEVDYFERCLQRFAEEPKLGIGGGMISHEVRGQLVCESPGDPEFHVRGATKIYKRECWEAIGGLITAPGWDTVDELKANMMGWTTGTFKEVPLRHHRFTGTADGAWKNQVKCGLANYTAGYHPVFMALKCMRRILRYPYFIGAVGLWWGFSKGYLNRVAQVPDRELVKYVRRQQFNRLLLKPSLW